MASPILHIKDSYYFEVPKALLPCHYGSKASFPTIWVQLDDQFQLWEADRLYSKFADEYGAALPPKQDLIAEYVEWKHHDHANAGKPFDRFLEEAKYTDWFAQRSASAGFAERWAQAKEFAGGEKAVETFQGIPASVAQWNWRPAKVDAYNEHLSGKILIPQPFGTLRNFYQPESGFCISKFMVIEVIIALILWVVFAWLGRQIGNGDRPRGRIWNLLEVFVVYIRDEVARPVIGAHDADRFVPLLLTIFFFILGCNLFGMLPWMGAPTGSLAVTFAMACVTFGTVILFGMLKFGPVGFFLNQIPSMDLPLILAVFLKPMILAIELAGMCIKHAVLAVRLLANMVAGHIVLLAIMGLAFSLEGSILPSGEAVSNWVWLPTAAISIIGSTLISCLELFVAFLQAYIFTFLSSLFIGAAIHHH